jgi:hypothetical protein
MSSGTTNSEIEYQSYGVPLDTYELTPKDHRDQKTAEGIRDAVKEQAARWEAEEAADPELREARRKTDERGRNMLFTFASQTHDYKLMRWRVRLYCGHIVETRRHCTIDAPTRHGSSSMPCPEYGTNPARIVAYEPLGVVAKPPWATATQRQLQPTRQSIEKRLTKFEAEAKELRDRLQRLDD